MRILIVGIGAIGTLLGVALEKSGNDVVFYDRKSRIDSLTEKGLSLIVNGRTKTIKQPQTLDSLELQPQPFDFAVLCVKSYNTADFLSVCPESLFKRLVTIQNGIGNEELLAEKFGISSIVSASLTLPVAKVGQDIVEIANNKGGIAFACPDTSVNCSDIAGIFRKAGFAVVECADFREMKWSKLMLNVMANAISAITGMTMSEIFDNRKMTVIEKNVIVEILALMKKMSIKPIDLPGYPVKAMAMMFASFPPTFIEIVMSFAQRNMSRGTKMPSLFIDLESGCGFSENDVLNGAVYKEAQKLGLEAKANEFLFKTLDNIVSGKLSKSDYRDDPDKLWAAFQEYRGN